MKLILATDQRFAIGRQGNLLFQIPEDRKRLYQKTEGNIVVMGRKTFEAIPLEKPLRSVHNIVLTHKMNWQHPDVHIVHNPQELIALLKQLNPGMQHEEYVIGGGHIVADLLDYCTEAMITMVETVIADPDVWVPDLNSDPAWSLISVTQQQTDGDLSFSYRHYKRVRSLPKDRS